MELLAKFPHASVDVLDGHYNDLLNALRHGSLDIVYGVLRLPKWAFDIEEKFLSPIGTPWSRAAIIPSGRNGRSRSRSWRVTTGSCRQWGRRGGTRSSKFSKGHRAQPKVSIETTSMGIYRAVLATSDRLSLFSHREVAKDRTMGFEALPYHSPRLQRDDGIALRKDWRPTASISNLSSD